MCTPCACPCAHQLPWKETSMSTHYVPPFQHQHCLYQAKYAEQRSPCLTLQYLIDQQNTCTADEKSRGQRRSVLVNCRKQRRRQHVNRSRRASLCRNKMNSQVVSAKSKISSHFFLPGTAVLILRLLLRVCSMRVLGRRKLH